MILPGSKYFGNAEWQCSPFCLFVCVETIAEEIEIPSVFTSYYASQILRTFIIPEQG